MLISTLVPSDVVCAIDVVQSMPTSTTNIVITNMLIPLEAISKASPEVYPKVSWSDRTCGSSCSC